MRLCNGYEQSIDPLQHTNTTTTKHQMVRLCLNKKPRRIFVSLQEGCIHSEREFSIDWQRSFALSTVGHQQPRWSEVLSRSGLCRTSVPFDADGKRIHKLSTEAR